MEFSTLLEERLIFPQYKFISKSDYYDEVFNLVSKDINEKITKGIIIDSINEREKLGPIVFGNIAIPHARIENLDDLIISIATSKTGFDFNGEKVNMIVLILTALEKSKLYLQCLKAISTIGLDTENYNKLISLEKSGDIIDFIKSLNLKVKEYLTVKDLMNENVISIRPETTVHEALILMYSKNISGLPVVDEKNKVVGYITGHSILNLGIPDYLKQMENVSFLRTFEPFSELLKNQNNIQIKNIMLKDLCIVNVDASIIEVAIKMVEDKIRRIFIVDENQILKGVITRKDLIKKVMIE